MGRPKLTPEDLWDRVKHKHTSGPNDCWEFNGRRNKAGYGRLGYNYKTWSTHDLAWTLTNGAIPEGQAIKHSCENPPCCNPAHMSLREMIGKRKAKPYLILGLPDLTEDDIRELRRLYEEDRWTHSRLAAKYKLNTSSVGLIVRRVTWTHVY